MRLPWSDRPDARPGGAEGEVIRVLLVDDDQEEHMLLRSRLRGGPGMAYQVDWVPTYERALEHMRQHDYDAYLVDYQLGARSGLDLTREARAEGCVEPIIMLTGFGSEQVDHAALEAGATDFVEKGRSAPAVLERTLRYAVAQARVSEALRRSLRQVSGLEALGRMLSESGPTPEVLDEVVQLLGEFGHHRASLYLLEEGMLRVAAVAGYGWPAPEIDPRTGRLTTMIMSGRPQTMANLTIDPAARSAGDPMEMCFPLVAEGECLGLLNIALESGSLEDEEGFKAVRVIADRLAVALALNRAIRGRSFVDPNSIREAALSWSGGSPR